MSDCARGIRLVSLLLGLGLTGCSDISTRKPAIADSVFVEVLVDLHLVQAALDEAVVSDTTLRRSVLQEYDISEEQMRQTTAYYVKHPDEYLLVYNRVVDRISEEEESSRQLSGPAATSRN